VVDLPYQEAETLRMRRYLCTACDKDFTTPLQGVGKKNTTPSG
jgi:transposase-like protein